MTVRNSTAARSFGYARHHRGVAAGALASTLVLLTAAIGGMWRLSERGEDSATARTAAITNVPVPQPELDAMRFSAPSASARAVTRRAPETVFIARSGEEAAGLRSRVEMALAEIPPEFAGAIGGTVLVASSAAEAEQMHRAIEESNAILAMLGEPLVTVVNMFAP